MLTKDQSAAVKMRGVDLLVSASAGTGKTHTMVERIVSLVEAGECELKDLLVLTFTNASAADMRRRLRVRLAKSDGLSEASIGTFHKFCGEIIRTYFNVAGVSPDFNVLDELAAAFLKSQVLTEVITTNYKKCFEAIETFCVNRKTDSFQKMLIKISEFLASRGDAEEWLTRSAVAAYETDIALRVILDYYKQAGEYFVRKFDDEECKGMAARLAVVKSYADLRELALTANFTRLKRGADEDFKKLREQFKELIKKLEPYKITLDTMIANGKRDREIIKQVIHIVREFESAYARAKIGANKLDFNDLEKYTCVVLENAEVAAESRAKYKYIFIDEYQDTNPMQEKIMSLVAGNKNVFLVGDVKQSIYGFRGCEATIFAGKMTDFENNLSGKVVCLNQNFRSRQNILKFSNLVFGKVMKSATADIDYNATSKFETSLRGTKQSRPADSATDGIVDVTLVNTSRGTAAELQASVIAQKIKQLKVPLKDICILSRSRTHFGVLADTLERAGIAVNVAAEQNACELFEIALLNNMLFAVSNFYNDVPLVLLMQSFVFGFTAQQLAEIKLGGGEEIFYKNIRDEKFLEFLNKYHTLTKTHSVVDIITTFITEFNLLERLDQRMVGNIYAYLNKLRNASYATTVSEFLYLLENELIEIKITPVTTCEDAVQIITMHSSKGLEFPVVFIFDISAQFNLNDTKQLMVIDKKCGLCVYTLDADEFTKTMSIARLGATISARRVLVAEEMRLLYVAMTRAKEKLFIVGGGNVGKMNSGCEDYDILCAKSDLHFLTPTIFESDECFSLNIVEAGDVEVVGKVRDRHCVRNARRNEQVRSNPKRTPTLEYPYPQAVLKNSVSSLTAGPFAIAASPQAPRNDVSGGKEYGTQYHKEMQYIDLSELEKLIPEIKGFEIYREVPFLQQVDDIIIQGVIDLLAIKDGHAIIVDYKTTRTAPEKLIELYKPQLEMYAAAVRQGFELKSVSVYIYSVFNSKLIIVVV